MMNKLDDFLKYEVSEPDLKNLNEVTRRFMLRVPFENIDVQNHKEISVAPEDLMRKVVDQHRGGYCYELNGLFHHYLAGKGYDVSYAAATIKTPKGWSRKGSHMMNLVKLDGMTYVVDVGFGDLPTQVIPLNGSVVEDVNGVYRAVTVSDETFEVQKLESDYYHTLYMTDFKPVEMRDFAAALDYNQHNPESIFVKKLLITQAKSNGRVTMSQDSLTITTPEGKQKKPVTAENYRSFLVDYFNLDVTIDRLENNR